VPSAACVEPGVVSEAAWLRLHAGPDTRASDSAERTKERRRWCIEALGHASTGGAASRGFDPAMLEAIQARWNHGDFEHGARRWRPHEP
jgi:hypothetical protein